MSDLSDRLRDWDASVRHLADLADLAAGRPLLRVQFLPFAAELLARLVRHTERR